MENDTRLIFIKQYFNIDNQEFNSILDNNQESLSDLEQLKNDIRSKGITIISEKEVSIFDLELETDEKLLNAFSTLITQTSSPKQPQPKKKFNFNLFKNKNK